MLAEDHVARHAHHGEQDGDGDAHAVLPEAQRTGIGAPGATATALTAPFNQGRTVLSRAFPGSDHDAVTGYAATVELIVTVIGECTGFEFLIGPQAMTGSFRENHHDVLIAVGEPVVSQHRRL